MALPPLTKEVAETHRFPLDKLERWCMQHVAGFAIAAKHGPLSVLQFAHGQSNPTFLLTIGGTDNNHQRRYVLRKKPNGSLLPSAHAIEREYRVLSALRGSRVPVPRTYALCEDSSVIGTPFYIMQYVQGRIFKDVTLPDMKPAERFGIYAAMNKVLAELHMVDFNQAGLSDYGKPENYVQRNVQRWTQQYQHSKTEEVPAFEQLSQHLINNVPTDHTAKQVSLIHGDFRLDNLIFHPTEPRVLAVLDWELSTIGAPITDLAYNCMPYYQPARQQSQGVQGLAGLPLAQLGIPELASYQKLYFDNQFGRRTIGPLNHWNYYIALAFFRMAAITQGVYKRHLLGNASSSLAGSYGEIAKAVAAHGLNIVHGKFDVRSSSAGVDVELKYAEATLGFFNMSARFWELRSKLLAFMDEYVYPNEMVFHSQYEALVKENGGNRWVAPVPILEELKAKAKEAGLWNLFLSKNRNHNHGIGPGLSNLEYAPLAEIMGRVPGFGSEVFNCAAPDTGNMEVLAVYGSKEQQEKWLKPLLNGEIRSCFGMTEPLVASSDATHIEASIERVEDGYIINARKWWISGAGDPRCKVCIFMGCSNPNAPKHRRQSMVLVPLDAPGVRIVRPMQVFGSDDAPHGHPEIEFKNVKIGLDGMLLGEGRGFEIAQGRLGPGRIHHCMRTVGMAERAYELAIKRIHQRAPHGSLLALKGYTLQLLADMRIDIERTRLLTLQAAAMMDSVGNKHAKLQIAMIKVAAPNMALQVIDRVMQLYGAMGISQDTILPHLYTHARTLRFADGPDEVHRDTIAKLELARVARL